MLFIGLVLAIMSGCASKPSNLYQEIGGAEKVTQISDHFIEEIQFNKTIFHYFQASDVERFREKFIEHLCHVTDGGCQYTGDNMVRVHEGMNINENDFNLTVELLVNAMNKADIPHPTQNKLLNRLAKMRGDIIYR